MTPMKLLLIAHGSRDPRHAATVAELAAQVHVLRPDLDVGTAYLDHCAPRIPQALAAAADTPAADTPVVAVPLLLARAFHARTDIPAALREAGSRLPWLKAGQADVLGPSPLLLDALDRRLAEAGVRPDRATGIVLAAAGSSDAAANAVTRSVADAYARSRGWAGVEVAHASAAPPRVADAVAALRARGVRRIAVAPYLLAPGLLPDRIAAEAAACGVRTLAAPLGAAPELARLVLRRYDAACGITVRAAAVVA
jgi:sirohydrochlorin ferrochelatase